MVTRWCLTQGKSYGNLTEPNPTKFILYPNYSISMSQIHARKKKGLKILSKINDITKIGKGHYLVNSQTTDKQYHVKVTSADIWTCTCPDFMYRLLKRDDKRCKHIHSCISLKDAIDRGVGQAMWCPYTFAASCHLFHCATLSLISCTMPSHVRECTWSPNIRLNADMIISISHLLPYPTLLSSTCGSPPFPFCPSCRCVSPDCHRAAPVLLPLAVHLVWTGMSGLMPLSWHACMLAREAYAPSASRHAPWVP